jgi:hypothetical protein
LLGGVPGPSQASGSDATFTNSFFALLKETILFCRAEILDWNSQRLALADSRCLGGHPRQLLFQSDISTDYGSGFFIVSI